MSAREKESGQLSSSTNKQSSSDTTRSSPETAKAMLSDVSSLLTPHGTELCIKYSQEGISGSRRHGERGDLNHPRSKPPAEFAFLFPFLQVPQEGDQLESSNALL